MTLDHSGSEVGPIAALRPTEPEAAAIPAELQGARSITTAKISTIRNTDKTISIEDGVTLSDAAQALTLPAIDQVLLLFSRGESIEQIAQELGITAQSVRSDLGLGNKAVGA
jgi:DNA-directed RNA polymerase specialized sigma24 family protein